MGIARIDVEPWLRRADEAGAGVVEDHNVVHDLLDTTPKSVKTPAEDHLEFAHFGVFQQLRQHRVRVVQPGGGLLLIFLDRPPIALGIGAQLRHLTLGVSMAGADLGMPVRVQTAGAFMRLDSFTDLKRTPTRNEPVWCYRNGVRDANEPSWYTEYRGRSLFSAMYAIDRDTHRPIAGCVARQPTL